MGCEMSKQVVVEKIGGPAENYNDFTASFPKNDCRYAVFDFDFVMSENCQKSKIFLALEFVWRLDSAKARPARAREF